MDAIKGVREEPVGSYPERESNIKDLTPDLLREVKQ